MVEKELCRVKDQMLILLHHGTRMVACYEEENTERLKVNEKGVNDNDPDEKSLGVKDFIGWA